MKNKTKIVWAIFSVVFIGSLFFWYSSSRNHRVIEIKGKTFNVELARSPKKKSFGLSNREDIKDNRGMLFMFPKSDEYVFWMKNMEFDLDIIWINDGKIVHIEKNVSHDSSELINPKVKADQVLEINSGISDKYNFEIGDEVKIY